MLFLKINPFQKTKQKNLLDFLRDRHERRFFASSYSHVYHKSENIWGGPKKSTQN